ncbi:MAG: hypothetical protein GC160_27015 [Acidobacteria bacterium]|nr:hypothetical protein [Acidobacteriota bacterium]
MLIAWPASSQILGPPDRDFVGPPSPEALDFVGPPSPLPEPPPQIAPQFPVPNVPLLDQELEDLLGRANKEYLIPSPETVIKSIFGFVALLALAAVAGHPRVGEVERKLRIGHLATTGLPFVLLGLIASQPKVGVLAPGVLLEVAPLLTLGLGWVGFSIGYRFNAQLMENLPQGAGSVVGLMTGVPFVAVGVAASLLMLFWEDGAVSGELLRDAAMLGVAGAMTARSSPFLWRDGGLDAEDLERMGKIVQLERIVGILGLMLVAAYFRPAGATVAWQLPPTAWLFLTLGIGVAVGGVVYAVLSTSRSDAESLVLLLGSVSFAAGMAHYLRLSAISVCFLVGIVLANGPGRWKVAAENVATRLERPLYFLFLLIAGAVWRPDDGRGWALMALFVLVRLAGKRFAAGLIARQGDYEHVSKERQWLTYAPAGAISIAVVISAQNLYGGPRISWIVTAVIVGSILNEILLQALMRRRRAEAA